MKYTISVKQYLVVLLVLFGLAQLLPSHRTNPPVTAPIQSPPPVVALFQRACYDCHSNETVWPWYAKVAPVSWLVGHDVEEGRAALNFSTWGKLGLRDQDKLREEIWHKVVNGDMPPPFYILGHPDARVTTDSYAMLKNWSGVQE